MEEPQAKFQDVPEGHWAFGDVDSLLKKNIISGGTDYFRTDDPVTRAEFLKMVVLALDIAMEGEDVFFQDCPREAWYYPYVCIGSNAQIIQGKSADYFGAQEAITREDAAVILARALGLKTIQNQTGLPFSDAGSISDYAQVSVAAAHDLGLLNGFPDGTIRPGQNITRAEAAVLIGRMLEYKTDQAEVG